MKSNDVNDFIHEEVEGFDFREADNEEVDRFLDWVRLQPEEDTPAGDFISDTRSGDNPSCREHLRRADWQAIEAGNSLWRRWKME